MATNLKKTDVVIVGMGATGGVAALPLTQAGLDVIGLEAGTWLSPNDFAPDELRNNYRGWPQLVQKANHEVPTHRRSDGAPYSPRPSVHPMMNAVGGTTVHYWGQSWRLNPWDFKVVSATRARYGASRIPKGSTVEDWPFGLEELEPYYDKVEYEVGISGQAGNVMGRTDQRGNIFEGSRAREYPMPPLHGTGFTAMMADAAKAIGAHPFPGPAAINSRDYQGRSGCMYHGWCDRGGCPVSAKSSTSVSTIPKALATKRLNIVTRAQVTRIEVDARGRASGVSYLRDGETYFQPADIVLMGCFTFENVRLLLLSKSKLFPNGLSNNHGQVGRHYMTHNEIGSVSALFPHNLNNWYGLPAQGIAIDNWADDNFDHAGLDFIGGGNLWAMNARRPIAAASTDTFGKTKSWGSDWKAFVRQNADRIHHGYMQKTTLPYHVNYLDLDPMVRDPLGDPVIRITADYQENERRIAGFVQEKMAAWYKAAGAIVVQRGGVDGIMGIGAHAYGGTRMGDNPDTNVMDRWGFSHEVPNLGAMGASLMGTSGSRNPTLTVQALAWRTAQHLAENWKERAG
ncbi:MAG TPA: GMC family oxidoreductase [Rhizomicrobium sp.]|nr:GMC family oxidoreductase [Rhizomicrobium sp.]